MPGAGKSGNISSFETPLTGRVMESEHAANEPTVTHALETRRLGAPWRRDDERRVR